MHTPVMKQWWSLFRIHRLQILQWWDLGGWKIKHTWQNFIFSCWNELLSKLTVQSPKAVQFCLSILIADASFLVRNQFTIICECMKSTSSLKICLDTALYSEKYSGITKHRKQTTFIKVAVQKNIMNPISRALAKVGSGYETTNRGINVVNKSNQHNTI